MQNLSLHDQTTANAQPNAIVSDLLPEEVTLPPLLRAPLEIRQAIYGHFLRADTGVIYGNTEVPDDFNWKILSVCRQVREEAWQYFSTSNKWIQFAVFSHQDDKGPFPLEKPGHFEAPLQLFPKKQMNTVVAECVLTIRIGHGCGLKKLPSTAKQVHRIVFAYNEVSWITFCMLLSQWIEEYRNVSFDLNQRYKKGYTSLVHEILIYLMLVRRAERARFTSMMDQPLFERMAQNMTKNFTSQESWHNIITGLTEEVQLCHRQGDLTIGYILADYAKKEVARFNPLSTDGLESVFEPRIYASYSLATDLHIAFAELLNAVIGTDRGVEDYFSRDAIDAILEYRDAAAVVFAFPGMTVSQRCKAYYHRGLASMYMARYACDPANLELAKSRRAPGVRWDDTKALFIAAAKDFQYAGDIDPLIAVSEIAICKNLSAKHGLMEDIKPEIVEIDLPGYGIWRGDPNYWKSGPLPSNLAQQMYSTFQEQENHAKTEKELKKLQHDLGIKWREGPAGLLRLLAD